MIGVSLLLSIVMDTHEAANQFEFFFSRAV